MAHWHRHGGKGERLVQGLRRPRVVRPGGRTRFRPARRTACRARWAPRAQCATRCPRPTSLPQPVGPACMPSWPWAHGPAALGLPPLQPVCGRATAMGQRRAQLQRYLRVGPAACPAAGAGGPTLGSQLPAELPHAGRASWSWQGWVYVAAQLMQAVVPPPGFAAALSMEVADPGLLARLPQPAQPVVRPLGLRSATRPACRAAGAAGQVLARPSPAWAWGLRTARLLLLACSGQRSTRTGCAGQPAGAHWPPQSPDAALARSL